MMRAALAHTYGVAGRRQEALDILDQLTCLAKEEYVSPYFIAGIHLGLQEEGRCLEWLEHAYDDKSHWLLYLHIDPGMDKLRETPELQNLLRRIGLPPQVEPVREVNATPKIDRAN